MFWHTKICFLKLHGAACHEACCVDLLRELREVTLTHFSSQLRACVSKSAPDFLASSAWSVIYHRTVFTQFGFCATSRTFANSFLVWVFRTLRLCQLCMPSYKLTESVEENKCVKDLPGHTVLTCMLAVLRVLLNVTHEHRESCFIYLSFCLFTNGSAIVKFTVRM